MSPDEVFVIRLVESLEAAGLDYVIVGMAAASLQGVPVMTQDVDILVRDTSLNRDRLGRLAELIGSARPMAVSALTTTVTLIGAEIPVDVLFDRLPGARSFEGVRSRSVNVSLGNIAAVVASLEDVIASKEAVGRPKDLAHLQILRDTQRIRAALDLGNSGPPY